MLIFYDVRQVILGLFNDSSVFLYFRDRVTFWTGNIGDPCGDRFQPFEKTLRRTVTAVTNIHDRTKRNQVYIS